MQTVTKKTNRPDANSSNLNLPVSGLMTLPKLSSDAFSHCYEQASHQLFLASKELKEQSAKTITQSLDLKIINEIDVNREFKRHDNGEVVEIELLNNLTGLCESNLRANTLPEDYLVDLDIEDNHVVLTGYHIHEVIIDTSNVTIEERAVIYSAFEVVAKYQVPLMPPNWYLTSTNSLIGEIIDNDELELLESLAMNYDSVDELIEFISEDSLFESLDYFLGQMDGDLSQAYLAILEYERMHKDCTIINEYIDDNGLNLRECKSEEDQVLKHIEQLKKINTPVVETLLLVLNRLLESKLYTQFDRLEMEDTQPLDYSLTIIDAPYSSLIVHMQEQMLDELNQIGEPLREGLPFDSNTVERFNLLTDAYRALDRLNKGKLNER